MITTQNTPGERLESLLQELGYNDVQVADILGITSVSIGRWRSLKKISPRNRRTMYKLTTRLNINLDWIEHGKGKPFINDKSTKALEGDPLNQIKNLKKEINEYKEEIKLLKLKNERLDEILFLNAKLIDQLRLDNQRQEKEMDKLKTKKKKSLKKQST